MVVMSAAPWQPELLPQSQPQPQPESNVKWRLCPVCRQDRRTNPAGRLAAHRRYDRTAGTMVACAGENLYPVRYA